MSKAVLISIKPEWCEKIASGRKTMFDELEAREPDHFAVKQYKKYKLAAGKTAKSILISCGSSQRSEVVKSQPPCSIEFIQEEKPCSD